MRGVSCSCLGVQELPGYCKVTGGSCQLLCQDVSLIHHQIQVLATDLPEEAEGLGEEGDQKETGNEGENGDHRQSVACWWNLNLEEQQDWLEFVVVVFWAWAFS